jgi:hypothetical protein
VDIGTDGTRDTRLGDRNQANNYMKLARQLDSQCRLIEQVETEFQNLK